MLSPRPPFLLTPALLRRLLPQVPLSCGIPRADDRRLLNSTIYVIHDGFLWRNAPTSYGPHKTLDNGFVRWSRRGVFDRIFAALAARTDHPNG